MAINSALNQPIMEHKLNLILIVQNITISILKKRLVIDPKKYKIGALLHHRLLSIKFCTNFERKHLFKTCVPQSAN